ncbi:MAG: hypothetical protein EAZ95_14415 [Bacteroidetes bacterium]|nr:MAG: hypothetical protein EAZ95_14415 [Bacteroidota bacterium]
MFCQVFFHISLDFFTKVSKKMFYIQIKWSYKWTTRNNLFENLYFILKKHKKKYLTRAVFFLLLGISFIGYCWKFFKKEDFEAEKIQKKFFPTLSRHFPLNEG